MDMFIIVPALGLVGMIFALLSFLSVLKKSEGSEKMKSIAAEVQKGAMVFSEKRIHYYSDFRSSHVRHHLKVPRPSNRYRIRIGSFLFNVSGFYRHESRYQIFSQNMRSRQDPRCTRSALCSVSKADLLWV